MFQRPWSGQQIAPLEKHGGPYPVAVMNGKLLYVCYVSHHILLHMFLRINYRLNFSLTSDLNISYRYNFVNRYLCHNPATIFVKFVS